jgi:LytR cell envelope-related transcriptional attenuator
MQHVARTAFVSEFGPAAGLASGFALIALSIAYIRHARQVRGLLRWASPQPEQRTEERVSSYRARRRMTLAIRGALGAIALVAVVAGLSALFGAGHRPTARDRLTTAERGVPVLVVNETGTPGLGLRVLERLSRAGFEHEALGGDGTLASSQESTVRYRPGGAAAAQDAARILRIDGSPGRAGSGLLHRGYRIAVILGRESANLNLRTTRRN